MSENILKPLGDSLSESIKVLLKCTKKVLGLSTYDFKDLFEKIGLKNNAGEYPKLVKIKDEEYFKTYIFNPPVGITINDFKNKDEKISFFLGIDKNNIRFEIKENYNIAIKVMTKIPEAIYDPISMKRNDFKIPLGYSLNNNKMIYWDLISSYNTHCYIAGSSGGGKSITLRLILTHLINCKSKRDIEFSIINTKRVDLKDFQYAKHTKHYMIGTEGVEEFLLDEIEEMERRYKLLEKNDCDDLTEYRKKIGKIPYRLIVVEEISSYKGNKEYQRAIELIASQGRGAGIIILLVTQLPSHEIMPNTIKCNINTTIGLKTKDAIRSEIIAGKDSGLEKLRGNGHSKIFNGDYEGVEYQGLYIDKQTMKEIINNNCKNKRAIEAGTSITPDNNKKL